MPEKGSYFFVKFSRHYNAIKVSSQQLFHRAPQLFNPLLYALGRAVREVQSQGIGSVLIGSCAEGVARNKGDLFRFDCNSEQLVSIHTLRQLDPDKHASVRLFETRIAREVLPER